MIKIDGFVFIDFTKKSMSVIKRDQKFVYFDGLRQHDRLVLFVIVPQSAGGEIHGQVSAPIHVWCANHLSPGGTFLLLRHGRPGALRSLFCTAGKVQASEDYFFRQETRN